MFEMFFDNHTFNQDIGSWDVSSVTNMRYMFRKAYAFNKDIRTWRVSGNTYRMMIEATAFQSAYSSGDSPGHAFFNKVFTPTDKAALEAGVNGWIDGSITASTPLTGGVTYGDINLWNVSAVTDMSNLFKDETAFNSDISRWDVSSVTNMNAIFKSASAFNQDISSWEVSSVTDMNHK